MKTVKHCRACKAADMLEIEYAQDLTVKGVDLNVAGLHAWECPECSARVETAAQIDFNAGLVRAEFLLKRAEFKRQQGLLTGEEVLAFRTRFKLTQKDAANIFGGGLSAFAKYEAEDVVQNTAMDRLLRLCIAFPENVLRLAKTHGVTLSPDVILHIENLAHPKSTIFPAWVIDYGMPKIKIPDPSEASANDHDFKIYSHGKLVKRASERITATELSELAVMAA